MNVIPLLLSWALFLYLLRSAWPRVRSDLARLRSWLGLGVVSMGSRGRADRAQPGSTDAPPPAAPADIDETAQSSDPAVTALRRARVIAKHRTRIGGTR